MEKVFIEPFYPFLFAFYHKLFASKILSAILMFVVFAESLDSLQNLVENKFSDIRNVERKPFSFPGHPCTREHLQVYYLLKTS
jgi:secreted Zn-dependent insulinase-like peptidase